MIKENLLVTVQGNFSIIGHPCADYVPKFEGFVDADDVTIDPNLVATYFSAQKTKDEPEKSLAA